MKKTIPLWSTRSSLCFVLLILFTLGSFKQLQAAEKQAIVLLHGLGDTAKQFDKMKGMLEKKFPKAQIVALTSSEGQKSLTTSIEEQAEAAFWELKEKIADSNNTAILLIGNSQGGLRGYTLLHKYANALKIKGLVTIGTPWEGVPGIKVTRQTLNTGSSKLLFKDVKEDLKTLSISLGYPPETLENNALAKLQKNETIYWLPGVNDLIPDSDFLQKMAQMLQHNTMPILAIAGAQNDLSTIVGNTTLKGKLQALNKFYELLTVGNHPKRQHDMTVPVYSQHALDIAAKNFKRVFVSGVYHDPIVLGVEIVPKDRAALHHSKVTKAILSFAKRQLKKRCKQTKKQANFCQGC